MRRKYVSLEGENMWPHKPQKQKHDEPNAMQSKINVLQQKVDRFSRSGSYRSSNKTSDMSLTSRDQSDKTCFGCGEKGHIRPNCPHKDNNNNKLKSSSGSNSENSNTSAELKCKPFASGESEIKTVNGVEYKWCSKCKFTKKKKSMWRSGRENM